MKVTDVYTKKSYTCKTCNQEILYGKITDDNGVLYTTDGRPPNGKFGKESNVVSGAVDSAVKDRLHSCTKHYVEEAIAKSQGYAGDTTLPQNNTKTLDNFKPEYVSEAELVLWNDLVAKVAEYTILAQKKLGEYTEIQNPALKGLITKEAFSIYATIKESQRNG